VKLAEQGLEQFRSALTASVRQKAYEVLVAQQKQKAAADVAMRAEELVSMLVQRETSGVTPLLEIRVIEAAILKLRRAESEIAKQLHTAQLDLNQFCGRALSESVTIAEAKLPFPALPPVSELLRRAVTGNFELLQRRMELEQQGFKVRLAKSDAWPSITTGPVIEQEYAGEQETRATFAVSLPVPLWNQNKGNIEVAKARQLQAQTSLLITQREVERRIREAAHTYELYRKEITRWNSKAPEELREAAQLADRHYRLGAVPLSTYLETQSSYLEALDVLCATQADALQALVQVEKLTGSKIK
ncbi:MAG: TolC family protein, partial [Chthoniobacterales bacterium]